jgi:hypothetical protein
MKPSSFLTLALLLALPFTLAAQSLDMSLSFGAANAGGRTIGTLDVTGEPDGSGLASIKTGSGFLFAPRLTIHSRQYLSHEFSYVYTRANLKVGAGGMNFVDQGMGVGQIFYNALISPAREGSKVRPYLTGGAGLVSFYPPGYGLFSGVTVNRAGVNYGAGLRVQVTQLVHSRFDFRQVLSGSPKLYEGQEGGSHFRQNQFSAGLGITF